MTAQNWAEQIAAASRTARQADREALDHARSGFDEIARTMCASLDSAREANTQFIWLLCAAGGGLVAGIIAGLMIMRIFG